MWNCIMRFLQIVFQSNKDLISYELVDNVKLVDNVRIYV